ncbi:unnamed protein product [Camellia sinensis]
MKRRRHKQIKIFACSPSPSLSPLPFSVSLFALCLFLFLFDIHINTNPRPPFKITTTKNVSHHGRVALFPHCKVDGELALKQRTNTKKALTRNETRAAAEQQWVWRREEGCSVVVCRAAYTLPLLILSISDLLHPINTLSLSLSRFPNFKP